MCYRHCKGKCSSKCALKLCRKGLVNTGSLCVGTRGKDRRFGGCVVRTEGRFIRAGAGLGGWRG